jgi:probable HAF family extracellular repeat protein
MSLSPRRRPLTAALAVAGTALAATALAGPAHAATPEYRLTLSPLAGSQFNGININGDIIGSAVVDGSQTAALFSAVGTTSPLVLNPPASQAGEGPAISAEALNNADQVVGESDNGDNTAVLWPDRATPTDLSQLSPLSTTLFNTNAPGINNSSLIVGFGQNIHDANVPFTIQNNVVKMLPVLPSGGFDGEPIAVSDKGVIVGQADTTTSEFQAVEWVNGAIKRLPKLTGTFSSEALGVNDSGEAVGAAILNSDLDAHAVLWANGKATDLDFGTTGNGDAQASAINDSGVVVGDGADGDAFVFQNGVTSDLNTLIPAGSGVTLNTADGINDNGDIVGTATSADGTQFGYELTPVG